MANQLGRFRETNPNFSEAVEHLVREAAFHNPIIQHAMKVADRGEMSLEDALGRATYILAKENKRLQNRVIEFMEKGYTPPPIIINTPPTTTSE